MLLLAVGNGGYEYLDREYTNERGAPASVVSAGRPVKSGYGTER